MTSVEMYWSRIAVAANDPRSWNDLSKQEQEMVVYSINLLIHVLNGSVK